MTLTATMDGLSWEEHPLEFPDFIPTAPKMTRVKTDRKFTGAMDGQGVAFYNMIYHAHDSEDKHSSTASFNGLMYFSGEIEGKGKGNIVLISSGTYGSDGAICQWISDPRSGTGGFAGLQMTGSYKAKGMAGIPIKLDIQA